MCLDGFAHLTGAHFAEAAFAEHSIHAKRFVGDLHLFQPLPLQIPAEQFNQKAMIGIRLVYEMQLGV